ncbi:cupin domain-containing protein [Caballeronia sp. GAFFF1]|uniref:AraC family transcriptional regulator n=1 Tax=Caballeronia sp. GAFFF1 TaxID=2921779 RepID=UPI0020288599|nr:cupin domain-containing protein [Caballeronia sp. GAFFF1]
MDLLSRFLALMPISGRVDVRCHFGAPWSIDEGVAGVHEIRYHVLLSGHAVLEDGNGPPQRLEAGDIVLFPTRCSHRIHDGSRAPPVPPTHRQNLALVVAENNADGDIAAILCGRFLLGAVPDRLLRDHLPPRLIVKSNSAGSRSGPAVEAGSAADANSRLARLIALMREEASDERPGNETLVNHLSAALFALTLRFASESEDPPYGLLALAGNARLQAAVSAMFEGPGRPWTLDQFAELCHMSRATFARQFHEAIGRSATDLLTEVRMTVAGRALLETKSAVGEIGEMVGYLSEAAFHRTFKKQIGMSPARWRASGGHVQAARDVSALSVQ